MHVVDEHLLTVVEVADLLRVSPSTVRRWVRDGDVPAFRIGGRRVGIRRSDLGAVVEPMSNAAEPREAVPDDNTFHFRPRKLTPDEKARALKAIDEIERLRAEMLAERGGVPFSPPAWELLNEARDERIEQLP